MTTSYLIDVKASLSFSLCNYHTLVISKPIFLTSITFSLSLSLTSWVRNPIFSWTYWAGDNPMTSWAILHTHTHSLSISPPHVLGSKPSFLTSHTCLNSLDAIVECRGSLSRLGFETQFSHLSYICLNSLDAIVECRGWTHVTSLSLSLVISLP